MDERLKSIIDRRKPALTRKQRLELMPECKAFIDRIARDFDRDIAGLQATENGHSVQWGNFTPGPEGVPVTVEHYFL